MSYMLPRYLGENLYKLEGMSGNSIFEYWYYDEERTILHRADGPAVISYELSLPGTHIDFHREWWYMGRRVDCSSQEEFEKCLKIKAFW